MTKPWDVFREPLAELAFVGTTEEWEAVRAMLDALDRVEAVVQDFGALAEWAITSPDSMLSSAPKEFVPFLMPAVREMHEKFRASRTGPARHV